MRLTVCLADTTAVILVSYSCYTHRLVSWNLETDELVPGQWLTHKRVSSCCLSPDGAHIAYCLTTFRNSVYETFVVVSRPPFFTAVVIAQTAGLGACGWRSSGELVTAAVPMHGRAWTVNAGPVDGITIRAGRPPAARCARQGHPARDARGRLIAVDVGTLTVDGVVLHQYSDSAGPMPRVPPPPG